MQLNYSQRSKVKRLFYRHKTVAPPISNTDMLPLANYEGTRNQEINREEDLVGQILGNILFQTRLLKTGIPLEVKKNSPKLNIFKNRREKFNEYDK